jgi:hypothetical protein
MNRIIYIATLLAAASVALALPTNSFKSWDDLIENSHDIIIARCVATQDSLTPKPAIIFGNVFNSDIEVISVLKGKTNPGLSHLASLYLPYRGEYFLVFADYYTRQTNSGYSATEDYRVIPIVHFHGTNELAGKDLEKQIQLVLNGRLQDLNEEAARNNEEIKRIRSGLTKGNKETQASTNAIPAMQNR